MYWGLSKILDCQRLGYKLRSNVPIRVGLNIPQSLFFGDICCGVGQKDRSTLNCDTPQYYAFFAQIKI
jgi:hypothetical protein